MDISNKGFNLKQKIKKYNAERTIKYCDREIVRLKCRLQEIDKEKDKIEWEIAVLLRGKQGIREMELGESEVSE